MNLPESHRATLRELKRFDLRHGLPTAIRVLRAHLTAAELGRVLLAYVRLSLRDPLEGLRPDEPWDQVEDALVHHQLRAAVLIDDATREGLRWTEEDRLLMLKEVISETGSAFIGANIPFPTRQAWGEASDAERIAFVRRLRGRMFNARMVPAGIAERRVGFDVRACRFVQLCAAIDRPYLAPMFCEADSRFFAEENPRNGGLIRLRRTGTIATGAEVCDFRFTLR